MRALEEFQAQLASDLADYIGCPLRATEEAVAIVTSDWGCLHRHSEQRLRGRNPLRCQG